MSEQIAQLDGKQGFDNTNTKGVVRFGSHVFKRVMRGSLRNQDTLVVVAF